MERNCLNCDHYNMQTHSCYFSSCCTTRKVMNEISTPSHWEPRSPFSKDALLDAASASYASSVYNHYNKMYKSKFPRQKALERIKNVIFNAPATVVIWSDGTKTIVKCGEGEIYDPEKGLAMAISKYFFDNKGYFNDVFKKWLPEEDGTKMSELKSLAVSETVRNTVLPTESVNYSVTELAKKLGVSRDTIRRGILKGRYPGARKDNGKWIIPIKILNSENNN